MATETEGHIQKVSIDKINHKDPESWQGKTVFNIGIQIEGEWHNTAVFKDWDLLRMKNFLVENKEIELFFFMQPNKDGNGFNKKFRLVTKFDLLDRRVQYLERLTEVQKEQISTLIEHCFEPTNVSANNYPTESTPIQPTIDHAAPSLDGVPVASTNNSEEKIIEAVKPTPTVDDTDDLPF